MYSAKICGIQMDSVFGLYLPEYEVPGPEVQTNYKEVPFRDGAIDKTAPDGVVHFKDREWSLSFQKTGENVSANDLPVLSKMLMNAIHGRYGEIIFDDDPNYKWIGRVFVDNVFCENNGLLTAEISMITEPYKYGINDIVVVDEMQTEVENYTGDIVNIEKGIGDELTSLIVNMQPIQSMNGYSQPWPAGGGKNKFNKDDNNSIVDGYIASSAFSTSNRKARTVYVPISPSTTYTVSKKAGSRFQVATSPNAPADGVGFTAKQNNQTGTSITITSGASDAFIWAWVYLEDIDTGTLEDMLATVQIELGSPATPWSPYSNICPISGRTGLSVYVSPTTAQEDATTYAADWTSEAGTVYGGTDNPVTGDLVSKYGMVDLGTLTWVAQAAGHFMYTTGLSSLIKHPASNTEVANVLCSAAQTASASDVDSTSGALIGVVTNGNVCFRYDGFSSSPEQFKMDVAGIQLVYELATPLTYQLAQQEVTLLAQSNIWSDSGDVDVAVSKMDKVVLSNGRKPITPKINISSNGNITFIFDVKGERHTAVLGAGEWKVPDLVLFEGDTEV